LGIWGGKVEDDGKTRKTTTKKTSRGGSVISERKRAGGGRGKVQRTWVRGKTEGEGGKTKRLRKKLEQGVEKGKPLYPKRGGGKKPIGKISHRKGKTEGFGALSPVPARFLPVEKRGGKTPPTMGGG